MFYFDNSCYYWIAEIHKEVAQIFLIKQCKFDFSLLQPDGIR